nr:hypothetical protein [Tanacetum cinerariifolium]
MVPVVTEVCREASLWVPILFSGSFLIVSNISSAIRTSSLPIVSQQRQSLGRHAENSPRKGKLNGVYFCVPTVDESVVDLNVMLEKSATYNEIKTDINIVSTNLQMRKKDAKLYHNIEDPEPEIDTDVPDGSSPVDQRAIDENEAGGLSG